MHRPEHHLYSPEHSITLRAGFRWQGFPAVGKYEKYQSNQERDRPKYCPLRLTGHHTTKQDIHALQEPDHSDHEQNYRKNIQ